MTVVLRVLRAMVSALIFATTGSVFAFEGAAKRFVSLQKVLTARIEARRERRA